MSDELGHVLKVLGKYIREHNPKIQNIRNTRYLYASLVELHEMVGMQRLKNSIALQVMELIDNLNSGRRNTHMLNSVIYGPPGVGKTQVGRILAKIWYGLGFLKGHRDESKKNLVTSKSMIVNSIILIFFIIICYSLGYIMAGLSYVYTRWGMATMVTLLLATLAIIAIVLVFWYTSGKPVEKKTESPDTVENDENIITVVSRHDFVAGYLGQTAIKTKALLTKNLGKVLFIDEAYSLLNDSRDSFGREALDTINLFLSEHPDEIIVILAGYKDKMQKGLFVAQQGLKRRCMWYFDCDPYDGRQLYDIFARQVKRSKLHLDNKNDIAALIRDHAKHFPSFGGDTERLLFFSKLEASRQNFISDKPSNSTLTIHHVKAGLQRLLDNNMESHSLNQGNLENQSNLENLTDLADRINRLRGQEDYEPSSCSD